MQSEVSMNFDSKQCFLSVAFGLWEMSKGKKKNARFKKKKRHKIIIKKYKDIEKNES